MQAESDVRITSTIRGVDVIEAVTVARGLVLYIMCECGQKHDIHTCIYHSTLRLVMYACVCHSVLHKKSDFFFHRHKNFIKTVDEGVKGLETGKRACTVCTQYGMAKSKSAGRIC